MCTASPHIAQVHCEVEVVARGGVVGVEEAPAPAAEARGMRGRSAPRLARLCSPRRAPQLNRLCSDALCRRKTAALASWSRRRWRSAARPCACRRGRAGGTGPPATCTDGGAGSPRPFRQNHYLLDKQDCLSWVRELLCGCCVAAAAGPPWRRTRKPPLCRRPDWALGWETLPEGGAGRAGGVPARSDWCPLRRPWLLRARWSALAQRTHSALTRCRGQPQT